MPGIDPFIRWAGGKSWLIEFVENLIKDKTINNYFEPFLGGAAVFFSLQQYRRAYLSDTNPELINTYEQVRDNPMGVLEYLSQYENTEKSYYRIRTYEPNDNLERAARFIYLNQTSYNGLYRVNKNGKYNVPYGFRTQWVYDYDRITVASQKLQNVRFKCADFSKTKYGIKEHDFVFLDPPYTVSHNDNGFIEYNKNLFSLDDQKRLSKYIDYIKRKGAYYVLTNAAHPTIQDIFQKDGDKMIKLSRLSLIGGKKAARGQVSEYVFTNVDQGGLEND